VSRNQKKKTTEVDSSEQLNDFSEHMVHALEVLIGVEERLFFDGKEDDVEQKTPWDRLDALVAMPVADFSNLKRDTFARKKTDYSSQLAIECAYICAALAIQLQQVERTFEAYTSLFHLFRFVGAAIPKFHNENIPISATHAASSLAQESANSRRKVSERFVRRFQSLGLTKNRAASVLANEFGITEEHARKKLQGVAKSA
jgi:hypothetical protein